MHHSSLKLISCDVTIILVVSLSGGNMMKLDAFEMLQPQKTLMTTVVQHSQHFMIRLDSLMECPQNPLNCNGHDPCIETVLKPHQRCPAKQGMENHEESKESRDESRESLQNAVPGLRFWFPSVEDFLHVGDLFQAIHSRGAETPCPEGRLQDRRFATYLHLIQVAPACWYKDSPFWGYGELRTDP